MGGRTKKIIAFGRLDLLIQFRLMKITDVVYGNIEDCHNKIRVEGAYTQQMILDFPIDFYNRISLLKPDGVFILIEGE